MTLQTMFEHDSEQESIDVYGVNSVEDLKRETDAIALPQLYKKVSESDDYPVTKVQPPLSDDGISCSSVRSFDRGEDYVREVQKRPLSIAASGHSQKISVSPSPSVDKNEKKVLGARKVVCEGPGCSKTPSYGFESDRRRRSCSQHKQQGMVYLKRRKCSMENCEKLSSYGNVGGSARFCLAHKSPDMVDLVNRRCEKEGCSRRPVFALPGQKARMCSNHRNLEMMDVVNQRCTWGQCGLLACYGLPGERARSCEIHRTEEMQKKKIRGSSPILPYYVRDPDMSAFCHNNLNTEQYNSMGFGSNPNLIGSNFMPRSIGLVTDHPASMNCEAVSDMAGMPYRSCGASQMQNSVPNVMSFTKQQEHNLAVLQAQHQQSMHQIRSNLIPTFGMNCNEARHIGYLQPNLIPPGQNGLISDMNHPIPQAFTRIPDSQGRIMDVPLPYELDQTALQAIPNSYQCSGDVSKMYGLPPHPAVSNSNSQHMFMRRQFPAFTSNHQTAGLLQTAAAQYSKPGNVSNQLQQEQHSLFQQSYEIQRSKAIEQYERMLSCCAKDEATRGMGPVSGHTTNAQSAQRLMGGVVKGEMESCNNRLFPMNSQNVRMNAGGLLRIPPSGMLPSCSKLLGQVNSNGFDIAGNKCDSLRAGRGGDMSTLIGSMNIQNAVRNFSS